MRDSSSHGGYIVTFNYDVLVELALGIDRFVTMNDYVSGAIDNVRLIKLHGSCDWYYLNPKTDMPKGLNPKLQPRPGEYRLEHGWPTGTEDTYTYVTRYPVVDWQGYKIHTARELAKAKQHRSGDFHAIPAVAIPKAGDKTYVCPSEHITALKQGLETIEKILVIGWKAGDNYLLELLRGLTKPVSLIVVSGSTRGAQEIAQRISSFIPKIDNVETVETFSRFLGTSECARFFSNDSPQ
jgi:hypothetical protein